MQMQYIKSYNLRKTEEYQNLSEIAVRVFNLLLDRYSLSQDNNYADEDGIYIQYSQMEMAWDLDRSDRHIRNGLTELKSVGLIKKIVRLYKRKTNKIYLELPKVLTPIKNPITEAKKKAKKKATKMKNIIQNIAEKVDEVIESKEKTISCHPVVEVEVKKQLGHNLTNDQKNRINEIKNLNTLTDENIKECVKTTIEKSTFSKMESKINFLITTLTNFKPKSQYTKVVRKELTPDWLKANNESWKNVYNQETKTVNLSDEDLQKIEHMKILQKQLLQQKG